MHDSRVSQAATARSDPLCGLDDAIERVGRQACVMGAFAAGSFAGAAFDRRIGMSTAFAATACTAGLLGARWILGTVRRARIHNIILRFGSVDRDSFAREVRRLARQSHREALAAALERALADGCRWAELLPASRPPPGARYLPANADTIRTIATGLRADRASLRAIVMLERLMRGGYGSALYEGGPEWLRRELGRIRFEIQSGA